MEGANDINNSQAQSQFFDPTSEQQQMSQANVPEMEMEPVIPQLASQRELEELSPQNLHGMPMTQPMRPQGLRRSRTPPGPPVPMHAGPRDPHLQPVPRRFDDRRPPQHHRRASVSPPRMSRRDDMMPPPRRPRHQSAAPRRSAPPRDERDDRAMYPRSGHREDRPMHHRSGPRNDRLPSSQAAPRGPHVSPRHRPEPRAPDYGRSPYRDSRSRSRPRQSKQYYSKN